MPHAPQHRVIPGLILLLGWACLAAVPLEGDQTLYRYEAFPEGLRPLNVTVADPVLTSKPATGEVPRGPAGGPFEPAYYGAFRGEHAYAFAKWEGEGNLNGNFSVEAFIRPLAGEETPQVIFSNQPVEGGSGIHISFEEGYLTGQIWMNNPRGGGTVHEKLISAQPVESGKWSRLVYRYTFNNALSRGIHELWIDGTKVAEGSTLPDARRSSSILAPLVGAGRAPDGLQDHLHADVLAVQVHDYFLSDFYLTADIIRDGSTYLGLPEYHNYLGLEESQLYLGGVPMERRLVETYFNSTSGAAYPELDSHLLGRWFLPLVNDGYVVQGMAGDPENNRIFLSMYHRTVDGVSYTFPSIVVEIRLSDYTLGNIFELRDEKGAPLPSHVGGVAYWDGLLFLPGPPRSRTRDPDLFVYDISDVDPASFNPLTFDGFTVVEIPATWKIRDPIGFLGEEARFNSLSFLGIHLNAKHKTILHLGNFQSDTPAPTHLFELAFLHDGSPRLTYLETHLQTHRRTQSMHYFFDAEISNRKAWKSFLCTSYGNRDSQLYNVFYLSGRLNQPLVSRFFSLPAGLEEVFSIDGKLWLTSESGSLYYQKRDNPWTDFFPFMALLDSSSLADQNDNGMNDQWEARYGLTGPLDPESDDDGDGFSLRTEYAWDTDPRSSASVPGLSLAAVPLNISLETSLSRFYTLQRSSDAESWQNIPGLEHRRGSDGMTVFQQEFPGSGTLYRVLVDTE